MISFLKKVIGIPAGNNKSYIFWRGAYAGLAMVCIGLMIYTGLLFNTGLPKVLIALVTLILGAVVFFMCILLGHLIQRGIGKIPTYLFAFITGVVGIFIFARLIRFGLHETIFYPVSIIFLTCVVLLSGSIHLLIRQSEKKGGLVTIVVLSLTVIGLICYFFASEGSNPYPYSYSKARIATLSGEGLTNPGSTGKIQFDYFTYGSGNDERRKVFREDVKYKSQQVDASLLLPEWKGSKAKWRERFWGFGVKEFPLNGRVWMPKADDARPLVLIVHGNHGMEDFSDDGYAYLGELLASKGFIAVSVDENFINGTWSGDFMGKEMPVRAWLLLKHLDQWRTWTQDPDHDLYRKADLDNVMLVGHSRGGEAVAIAAAFNELDFFPDNAHARFDFHFGIKGLVAIAPTDKRYSRRIELKNISYLSLQGSYDSDESSFFGFRQYQRIAFSDSVFHMKSGVYIHGANHGQFNSGWGRYDSGPPFNWILNTAPLMTMKEQMQIAQVYLTAFAETVLYANKSYIPLFKNSATASDWLPEAAILNTYKDSYTDVLIDYEEDIDLTTGATHNVSLTGVNLRVWREETLQFRDKDTQSNNTAILGWLKSDSTKEIPEYKIQFAKEVALDSASTLLISLGSGDAKELKSKSEAELNGIDFTIRLTDSLNNSVAIPISAIKKVAPPLNIQFVKFDHINEDNFGSKWEPALQTFEISPVLLNATEKSLNGIKNIDFVFDKTSQGIIILDEISLGKKL